MLEREPVVMPAYQWDISDPVACLEVIFGNGEDFRTGQAAGPGTVEEQWAVGGVQKAPYGPHVAAWHRLVQGAQGTMGIVTWASLRCELLPKAQEPFVVGSAQLDPLLEMADWLIRLRMVNECFVLSNTDLAAMFATDWPADFKRLKAELPAWTLFYMVAGYEYFPEERVSVNVKDISALASGWGRSHTKSVGGLSARDILKAVQKPCAGALLEAPLQGRLRGRVLPGPDRQAPGPDRRHGQLWPPRPATRSPTGVSTSSRPCRAPATTASSTSSTTPPMPRRRSGSRTSPLRRPRALWTTAPSSPGPMATTRGMIMNRDAATVDVLKKLKQIFDPERSHEPGQALLLGRTDRADSIDD